MGETQVTAFKTHGSYILFKQIIADEIGHLYRAGEFDKNGVSKTVFLPKNMRGLRNIIGYVLYIYSFGL